VKDNKEGMQPSFHIFDAIKDASNIAGRKSVHFVE
jgi:hypothetical protein